MHRNRISVHRIGGEYVLENDSVLGSSIGRLENLSPMKGQNLLHEQQLKSWGSNNLVQFSHCFNSLCFLLIVCTGTDGGLSTFTLLIGFNILYLCNTKEEIRNIYHFMGKRKKVLFSLPTSPWA